MCRRAQLEGHGLCTRLVAYGHVHWMHIWISGALWHICEHLGATPPLSAPARKVTAATTELLSRHLQGHALFMPPLVHGQEEKANKY